MNGFVNDNLAWHIILLFLKSLSISIDHTQYKWILLLAHAITLFGFSLVHSNNNKLPVHLLIAINYLAELRLDVVSNKSSSISSLVVPLRMQHVLPKPWGPLN